MRTPTLLVPLWWDHNAHYHRWLLRQLPSRPHRALDVGCGAGALACRLAEQGARVDAVDVSPRMIERAGARCPDGGVRWLLGDVLDPDLPVGPAAYDVVTAVASLHHLPLRPALHRLAQLVRPGGVLGVVGLYRPVTAVDRTAQALAVPVDVAYALGLALAGRGGRPGDVDLPLRLPETSLREVAQAAADLLPGARLRRSVFRRYLLAWQRPR